MSIRGMSREGSPTHMRGSGSMKGFEIELKHMRGEELKGRPNENVHCTMEDDEDLGQ